MSKKAEQKKLEQEQKKALALKLEKDALKAQQEASSIADTQDQDDLKNDQDQSKSTLDGPYDYHFRVKTPFLLAEVDGIRELAKIGQIIRSDMINEGYLTDHFVERVSAESGEE